MNRRKLELKERIRREFTKLIIKILNDLNIRMSPEYSYIIEDLVGFLFELITMKEDQNEDSSQ